MSQERYRTPVLLGRYDSRTRQNRVQQISGFSAKPTYWTDVSEFSIGESSNKKSACGLRVPKLSKEVNRQSTLKYGQRTGQEAQKGRIYSC